MIRRAHVPPEHQPDGRWTRTEIADQLDRVFGESDHSAWLRKMDAIDEAQRDDAEARRWAEASERSHG